MSPPIDTFAERMCRRLDRVCAHSLAYRRGERDDRTRMTRELDELVRHRGHLDPTARDALARALEALAERALRYRDRLTGGDAP